MRKIINCKECKEEKYLCGRELCRSCYMKKWRKNHPKYTTKQNHKNGISQSMYKNKKCSSYFGINISESMAITLFDKVERAPNNNPGYDFIGNGFKIDVKGGCRIVRKQHNDSWQFTINENKIADYFLCLAFDNRDDLNPEYIWLIPGSIVNSKLSIRITISELTKWNKYKLDINNLY